MPKVNLTQNWISNILPREIKVMTVKETWFMDISLPNFGVRVKANGQASFGIRIMDERSRHKKMSLGDVKNKKVDSVRKSAFWFIGEYQAGRDPQSEQKKKRKDISFKQLVDDVIAHMRTLDVTKGHVDVQQSILKTYALPVLGRMTAKEIDPMDLDKVMHMSGLNPAGHNRLKSALSRVFKQAQTWRIRYDDPTLGVSKKTEIPRERFLSEEELNKVWSALKETPQQDSANALRLVILTGARPKEVLSATWDQFDLTTGKWNKPAMSVKQKRSHRVHIHELAVGILKDMHEERDQESPYVFPSSSASGHLTTIKTLWRKTKERAGLSDIRPYDLRKTFITRVMASGNLSLSEVMAITGHTQPSVLLKHYAFATGDGQKEAIEGAIKVG